MKTKITILFCILIAKCFSQTPTYDWVNSNGKLAIFAATNDVYGNVYISGTASGATTLGTTVLTSADNFISKISGSNEVVWVKKLPSGTCSFRTTLYADDNKNIVADSIGNVYLTGYFWENFTINDYTITDTLYPTDYCLLKFDSLGNTQWIKTIATPDESVIAPRLQYYNDETIIVNGRFPTTLIFEDGTTIVNLDSTKQGVFLANFNSNGNLIEAKQLPPIVEPYPWAFGYDEESIFVNEVGNIYRAFSTTAAVFSIDGTNYEVDSVFYYLYGLDTIFYEVPFAISPNYGLVKYDTDLNVIWQKVIRAGSANFNICSDKEDGVYFAGNFVKDFIVIDGDTLVNSNIGGGYSDSYICRFNFEGVKLWHTNSFGFYTDLRTDLIKNLYYVRTIGDGSSPQGFINKISPLGNHLWQKNIVTWVSHSFTSNSIDNFGNVFATGYLQSYPDPLTAVFDSITINIPSDISQGFVAKIGNCNLATPTISVSSTEICTNQNTILTCENANSYFWSNGDTTQSISVNTAGNYSVFAIDSLGCFAKSLDQEIVVIPLPSVAITANQNTLTANLLSAEYQWIDCNNGNQTIEGATNQSFSTESNGSYAVIVSDNGCTDTSECYTINMSGLNENLESSLFQIYPNPATEFLQIRLNTNQKLKIERVQIKNVLGQIIFSQNKIVSTIDVSNFSNGIYNLEVFLDQGIWQGQYVKE